MMNRTGEDDAGQVLDGGYCYLVKEERLVLSLALFRSLSKDVQGLCISRIYPERLRERKDLTNARMIWLSHTPGPDRCSPNAISVLVKEIFNAIEKGEPVLLDGLEYLIVQNGFNQTLHFIEQVNEFAMQRGGIVIVPLSPRAVEPKELALLERNLEVVSDSISRKRSLSKLMERY